jgi:hypothetical protein
MKKLAVLLGLSILLSSPMAQAQVSEEEVQALRDQIEMLTRRLDELEARNRQETAAATQASQAATDASQNAVAKAEEADQKATAASEQIAAASWAERMRWKGDFRYRYEYIDFENKDSRNRNRIRARAHLEADLAPTLQVGIGLATGGDDPVSSNQTIGGGGSSKDIKLDLAYFNWSGLSNTHIIGGKFQNFLIRPAKKGLMWDGDWRPEGLGIVWDNGLVFAQGLGTWLQGDSRNGTEFAWIAQAGLNLKTGDWGKLKIGGGYSVFDIAGGRPLYGDDQNFYGNSFVVDPRTGDLVYKYNYQNVELFAEWSIGKFFLFGDYTINLDADENDTGYLFGARYGAAKDKGEWDIAWFYERLEKDAVVGLLTDSDFGDGGTNARGNVFSGTYAFHKNWNFKLTYFLNEVYLEDPHDYDRFQMDLNFKFK